MRLAVKIFPSSEKFTFKGPKSINIFIIIFHALLLKLIYILQTLINLTFLQKKLFFM